MLRDDRCENMGVRSIGGMRAHHHRVRAIRLIRRMISRRTAFVIVDHDTALTTLDFNIRRE